jgi:hypothetical protein
MEAIGFSATSAMRDARESHATAFANSLDKKIQFPSRAFRPIDSVLDRIQCEYATELTSAAREYTRTP